MLLYKLIKLFKFYIIIANRKKKILEININHNDLIITN